MKILKKITSIMALLPLVFSQASAMESEFPAVNLSESQPKFSTYTYNYYKYNVGSTHQDIICKDCGRKVHIHYYFAPAKKNRRVLCFDCVKAEIYWQVLNLIATIIPEFDKKKIEELKSDMNFLSALPIIIPEGNKTPVDNAPDNAPLKDICFICLAKTIDLLSDGYYVCLECGDKACLACGIPHVNCPKCESVYNWYKMNRTTPNVDKLIDELISRSLFGSATATTPEYYQQLMTRAKNQIAQFDTPLQ